MNKNKSKAEVWGYIFGTLLVVLVIGFGVATLATFVIGLFFTFPLTLVNILKVWLALVVFRMAVGAVK